MIRKQLSRWANDFEALYNLDSLSLGDQPEIQLEENIIDYENLNNDKTYEEVLKAVTSAKWGKAKGPDDVPVEVLCNSTVIGFLSVLFDICFKKSLVPADWAKGIISPIPKFTTKPMDPLTYRGITVTSCVYKVLCSVLLARLTLWCNNNEVIVDEQNGFRVGRSTTDHLFTVTSVLETRKLRRQSTYAAFIDFKQAYDRIPRRLLFEKLELIGIGGNFFETIKIIYQDTKCCVRINKHHSDWFNVSCGLNQGCLLSPLLFSLYINDLAQDIKDLGIGVTIADMKLLSILLYADDIILLAETESDLQSMPDSLTQWCLKWGLVINTAKSNVIHFCGISEPMSKYSFRCGDQYLDYVSQYKYLGFILTEHLDFNVSVESVEKVCNRALGSLISKFKKNGGFPYVTFSKLYDTLVWPIMDYSSAIWGTHDYNVVNTIHNQACRFFLGVGKYTPTCAVHCEMAWISPLHRQWISVTRYLCRLRKMDMERINKKVFVWAVNAAKQKCHNWYWRVMRHFSDMGLAWILDYNVSDNVMIQAMDGAMMHNLTKEKWMTQLWREESKTGSGRNKLHAFHYFKSDIGVEPYVTNIVPRSVRSDFAKMGCGVAPLQIELGLYTGQAESDRLCPMCMKDIESENHVLIDCDFHFDITESLMTNASNIDPCFINMCSFDKFCFLMSHEQLQIDTAKTFLELYKLCFMVPGPLRVRL